MRSRALPTPVAARPTSSWTSVELYILVPGAEWPPVQAADSTATLCRRWTGSTGVTTHFTATRPLPGAVCDAYKRRTDVRRQYRRSGGGNMVNRDAIRGKRGRVVNWGWFLGWLVLGACVAVGLAAILTVGLVLLLLAAVAAGFLLRKGPRNAIAGSLTGLALPLFYLAYLNRSGPGTVCHATSGGQTCTDEYTPIPFLVCGVILFAAGFLIFIMLDRRSSSAG